MTGRSIRAPSYEKEVSSTAHGRRRVGISPGTKVIAPRDGSTERKHAMMTCCIDSVATWQSFTAAFLWINDRRSMYPKHQRTTRAKLVTFSGD
jgi:hypothetical protein